MTPWGIVGGLFSDVLGIAKEVITDKDKLIEFQFKAFELQQNANAQLLTSQTVPWVDALVKILMAINMLWRPLLGGAMTCFGAYMHYKGTPMSDMSQIIFDGAFPAWGVSRHIEKKKVPIVDKGTPWSDD